MEEGQTVLAGRVSINRYYIARDQSTHYDFATCVQDITAKKRGTFCLFHGFGQCSDTWMELAI